MKKKYETKREGSHVSVGEVKPLSPNFKVFVSSEPEDLTKPLLSPEEILAVKSFFKSNPQLNSNFSELDSEMKTLKEMAASYQFDPDSPWIQTYSGLRFTPLNPNIDSIVIQDISHALSMTCRFAGHIKSFYSVAQHCVLVSYLCDTADALHGLLHDASEAYLVDLPSPLKRSGEFDIFKEYENNLQAIIYKRFGLSEAEPKSVKAADTKMLYTEARDLFKSLRTDWEFKEEPIPLTITPLPPQEAKDLFMKRFYELTGSPETYYNHYLPYEYNDINRV